MPRAGERVPRAAQMMVLPREAPWQQMQDPTTLELGSAGKAGCRAIAEHGNLGRDARTKNLGRSSRTGSTGRNGNMGRGGNVGRSENVGKGGRTSDLGRGRKRQQLGGAGGGLQGLR